jgi:hypothetical protein
VIYKIFLYIKKFNLTYINLPKQKTLFAIKTKNNQLNMNADETSYNHFQSSTPEQQKAMKYLMISKILEDFND